MLAEITVRRRQQIEIAHVRFEKCLTHAATVLYDVRYIVCNACFESERDVKIIQTEIGIEKRDATAERRECSAQIRGYGGFADAALS